MKNILIGILSIVSLGSLFYAYSQRSQMSDCAIERELLQKLSEHQQQQAIESQKLAQQAQHEAMIQRVIAEEQINALKNKK